MQERSPVNTTNFLEETIKTRPRNKKRIMRRMFEVAFLAVIFGLIACLTMLFVSPILEEKLFPAPSNEVSFTEEPMQYTSEEIQPEDMLLEDKTEEPIIITTTEEPDAETELLQMIQFFKEKAAVCSPWITKVSGVSKEVSWLEGTNTSANVATGAIIADNGTELLILVQRQYIEDTDKIIITFVDGSNAEGYKKGEDLDAQLAVVAVSKEQLGEKTLEVCSVAEMASSNSSSLRGSVVMAVGSPNGITGSVSYGLISATGIENSSWDINYHLLMTDIYGSAKPNGFLVNMKGQLLGVLCNDRNPDDMKNMISAIGISELKKKIECMSNGKPVPFLGVKGTDVTEEAHNANAIPFGAYVLGVKLDSPAMHAGIQAGDVIVKFGAKDITSMDMLSYHLHQLNEDADVKVVIMRQSQGSYKESTLKIKIKKQY